MAKTKTLNGLAYSLAQSYFSTYNYYKKGYLSDWVVNGMNGLGIKAMEIDILQERITPVEMEMKPLMVFIKDLKPKMEKALVNNSLSPDFLIELRFHITIKGNRGMRCHGYAKGINGRVYEAGDYFENSHEVFDAFYNPFWEDIISNLKHRWFVLKMILWRKYRIGGFTLRYTRRLDPEQKIKI